MTLKKFDLSIWEPNHVTIWANQGEVNSRYATAFFKDHGEVNMLLSGKRVIFYALKPDKTQIYNECIIDTETSTATIMLTSQMSSTVGILECEFHIFDGDNNLLKVNGLQIIVNSKGDFSKAIESTSEFNALTQAINTANKFLDSVDNLSNLTTTEKSSLVGAINELNTQIIPISRGGTGATTSTNARKNLEVRKEYSLYSNSSGTSSTITLSDNYTNYDLIRVYFFDNGVYNSAELTTPQSRIGLANSYLASNGEIFYIHSCFLAFSGKTVAFQRNCVTQITSGSVNNVLTSIDGIQISKISGYKY